jgi:hypothetical protein
VCSTHGVAHCCHTREGSKINLLIADQSHARNLRAISGIRACATTVLPGSGYYPFSRLLDASP